MDEEIERLVVSVRADISGFAQDTGKMRIELEDVLPKGAERAGRAIENALTKALLSGKFGFEDLRKLALSVLGEIASAAVKTGLRSIFSGDGGGGGGLGGAIGGMLSGKPGRATGGPVGPGAAYIVGERGPELFVPTASGRIAANGGGGGGGGREVRIAITVNARGGEAPAALAQSSRQVARAVRAALEGLD